MNLVQLKYFHAVCMYGSISDAAEFLHISQPSLSNSIKELEKEFGVTLFSRHHRGVTLTEQGEKLREMTTDIVERSDRVEEIMRDMGQERKKLRLGVPPMIGSIILSDIYGDFGMQNKDVSIEITEAGSRELFSELNHDYIDMAFVSHGKPIEKPFASVEISKFEIVCCALGDNPVSKAEKVTPQLLRDIPLILFENSFFQTEEIKKWFASENITPNVMMQTGQLSTMVNLISNNLAVGFMFRHLAEKNPGLRVVPMANPIYANVSLVWKKSAYLSFGMKRFLDYIRRQQELTSGFCSD